jgi:hypothetical protein
MWRKLALLCASAATIAACNGGTAPTAPNANNPTPLYDQGSGGGTLGSGYSGESTNDPHPTSSDSSTTRYGGTLGSGY